MKKSTLYDIYNNLKKDTIKITDSLYKLMLLNSNSEDIFLEFCKGNSVNEDTFDYFINISECLGEISDEEIKRELIDLMIDIANDDYIVNNDDYDYILENIIFLLDYEYINAFDIYEDYEIDYYKSIIIKEYIRFIKSMKNINIDNLYNHDMGEIIDAYRMVLGDLPSTTSFDADKSLNQLYINRIKYFIDIISDKDIYEMEDNKFICMLNVIKTTENIEELKYLKNIIKINRTRNIIEFREIIDDKSSDVNETTINRINKKLGVTRKYDSKKEQTIIKRTVNNSEEELDIVKKILKPLD